MCPATKLNSAKSSMVSNPEPPMLPLCNEGFSFCFRNENQSMSVFKEMANRKFLHTDYDMDNGFRVYSFIIITKDRLKWNITAMGGQGKVCNSFNRNSYEN